MAKNTQKLSLQSLVTADDCELAFEFDSCLRIVESDIRQRPEVQQPRKVTLTVTMKPGEDPRTAIMGVSVIPHVPKRGPSARVLKVTASGMEMGSDRTDPDQLTIEDVEPSTIESEPPTFSKEESARIKREEKNRKDRDRRAAKKAGRAWQQA